MTALTGMDRPVVAFDWDGTLTSQGTGKIGQDNGAQVDLTPLRMVLEAGWYAGIMTCNVVRYVADVVERHGIAAYADEESYFKIPRFANMVLVSNRKLLADLYVDDHGFRYQYGDDPGEVMRACKVITEPPYKPEGDGCVPAIRGYERSRRALNG